MAKLRLEVRASEAVIAEMPARACRLFTPTSCLQRSDPIRLERPVPGITTAKRPLRNRTMNRERKLSFFARRRSPERCSGGATER